MIFDFTHIHGVGAGGIGVSALLRFCKARGLRVSGSDQTENEIISDLRAEGLDITVGHRTENIGATVDLLLYSSAISEDNPERQEAVRRGIPQISYAEALGEISKTMRTIAVAGTHGKSTTTAMLALILERAGLDPTVIVGSKVPSWPFSNLRIGKSDLFVVEACEHFANFLHLWPSMIVITSIEEDHLDFYRDINHICETFHEFINHLPPDGVLILNANDNASLEFIPKAHLIFFKYKENMLSLRVPGRHNIMNAFAASAAAKALGVAEGVIQAALSDFRGIWRRFEVIGEQNGAIIISDYAHHPTACAMTIDAAKEQYPDARIIAVFQPHQRKRTKQLFSGFVRSFDRADSVIITEIYDVAGREEENEHISGEDLVSAIKKRDEENGKKRDVLFMGKHEDLVESIRANAKKNDVVLLMGAGDIYMVAKKI